jgi:hypothetical protein
MDTAAFYATTSALSFTLLGFWWVVVQFRHDELTVDPSLRRLAFVVSLYFILPGLMSLGALIAGDSPVIWRLTFGAAGTVGMVAVVLGAKAITTDGVGSSIGRRIWLGLPTFAILTFVALRPDLVRSALALEPLQVEAAMLTTLAFLGIWFAWALFTEPRSTAPTGGWRPVEGRPGGVEQAVVIAGAILAVLVLLAVAIPAGAPPASSPSVGSSGPTPVPESMPTAVP